MAAPLPVVVRWGGTDYPTEVPADATIGDLKRKFLGIEVLPAKRYKFKQQTLDRDDLSEDVLISSLANNTINLIGFNQRDNQSYMKIFKAHTTSYECHVTDQRQPLIDFDETKFGMSKGIYEVISTKVDCILKTEDDNIQIDRSSVEMMKHFRHPNSIAIENVYMSGKKFRFVLSDSVDGTVDGYLNKGLDKVLDSNGKMLSSFFSKILIDLCGVLDNLIEKGVCPKNLTRHNLYLKIVNGCPQLKVLFNKVEPVASSKWDKAMQLKVLCGHIKSIISAYVTCEDGLEANTKFFCNFLGKEAANFFGYNLKIVAQLYPHNWTDEKKASYLIDLTSSTVDLRPAINNCGIKWPKNAAKDDILDELIELKEILLEDNRDREQQKLFLQRQNRIEEAGRIRYHIWNYDTRYPYDIVRMVRNLWKHFYTFPWKLQKLLGSKAGVLRALEKWCPGVWFLIYNAVGLV